MARRIVAVAVASAMLAGCGPPRTSHSVAFYSNDAAARAKVEACSSGVEAVGAPDCITALKAAGKAESQRALPSQPPPSRLNRPGQL